MSIIVVGNPHDGFSYIGPFDNNAEAVEWASKEMHDDTWWVAEVDLPGQD